MIGINAKAARKQCYATFILSCYNNRMKNTIIAIAIVTTLSLNAYAIGKKQGSYGSPHCHEAFDTSTQLCETSASPESCHTQAKIEFYQCDHAYSECGLFPNFLNQFEHRGFFCKLAEQSLDASYEQCAEQFLAGIQFCSKMHASSTKKLQCSNNQGSNLALCLQQQASLLDLQNQRDDVCATATPFITPDDATDLSWEALGMLAITKIHQCEPSAENNEVNIPLVSPLTNILNTLPGKSRGR